MFFTNNLHRKSPMQTTHKLTALNCKNGSVVDVRLTKNQMYSLESILDRISEITAFKLSKTLVVRRSLARYAIDIKNMDRKLILEEAEIISSEYRK